MPEIPRLLAVHWSLCRRSQAERSMDRHDRRIPNSIRILGGRTREGIWGGSQKADCRVRSIGVGGTLRPQGGQIFSEFRHPPLPDHRRVRRCLVALGGLVTRWHFIVVISAQQRIAKDGKAELPGKDSPAIGRNTCGGHPRSSAELQRQRRGWTTIWHRFPPKPFWAEFWAEIWRFIR